MNSVNDAAKAMLTEENLMGHQKQRVSFMAVNSQLETAELMCLEAYNEVEQVGSLPSVYRSGQILDITPKLRRISDLFDSAAHGIQEQRNGSKINSSRFNNYIIESFALSAKQYEEASFPAS